MHFGFDFLKRLLETVDGLGLLLLVSLKVPLSLGLFWSPCQVQPPFLIHHLLVRDFLFYLSVSFLQTLDVRIKSAHVLVNEQVLLFLFKEGFSDLLQILNAAFLLDLLEVLVDQVHVSLVLVYDFDLLLVFGNQVA
jgi:hypothetical protein